MKKATGTINPSNDSRSIRIKKNTTTPTSPMRRSKVPTISSRRRKGGMRVGGLQGCACKDTVIT
jgi:hypothetical protein